MMMRMRRKLLLVVGLVLFASCGAEDDAGQAEEVAAIVIPDQPPVPLGICADPADCRLEGSLAGPHVPSSVGFYSNPDLDDAVTRWSAKTTEIILCADGSPLQECVVSSDMPDQCKADFAARLGEGADTVAVVKAFEAVFIDGSPPCGPSFEPDVAGGGA